ncbi:hypothetical protein C0992_003947 [Termitomyces sp. T32_za158]|nr:hypothetical protein C0992_003947 [Termitomyces sp. T32_za158]
MSSLLINIQVTETGTNLKSDERDFLNYRRHVSPTRSTSGSDYPTLLPLCRSHWNGLGPAYISDERSAFEESVSSGQSDIAAGFCGYRYLPLQDPIGTPRRPGAMYPGGMRHDLASIAQVGREWGMFKANVVDVSAAESNQPNHVSVETTGTCRNAEKMHHQWMHTADLLSDQDEYLPRRPAPPRFAITRLPPPKEETRLPRLYAHNSRIRACADDAVRRMRAQAEKPQQNFHPFRRHRIPIGGSNPFQSTRGSLRSGEDPLGHIIRSLERLVEDDDDILAYLESRLSAKETKPQEVRRHKHRPAAPSAQANDCYFTERLCLSPTQVLPHLDEESIRRPEPEVGLFDDFPVCEMSIAMGLHDYR